MTFAGRRILLVEDDFLVALDTIELLEGTGCLVVGPAASLTAALELARSEPLDAAVLDINVAGEMIWPVAEGLERRGVPFLFLSAYVGQNVIPAPFASVPRLGKPAEKSRLLSGLAAMW